MSRRAQTIAGAIAIGVIGFTCFYSYHALSPDLLGVDAYFHLKLSALIADRGFVYDLPWLPFTIYSGNFVDDRLLFHLVLSLFAGDDMVAGGQIYASLAAAVVFVLFYLILSQEKVRWPALWTAGLAVCSWTFLFRLCLVRPPGISLIFLLAGCWCVLAERDRLLAPVGFLFAWTYGGFPLLLGVATCAAASSFVHGSVRYKPLVWAAAGCTAGLILNPYFPDNVAFLWRSYTEIELGTFPSSVVAGNEDYPYAASTAVRKALLVWVAIFLAMLAYLIRPVQMSQRTLFLFLLSIALLCLYLIARRFIEYWPPVALLFVAFAAQEWWSASPARWRVFLKRGLYAVIPLVLIAGGYQTVQGMLGARDGGRSQPEYRGASQFLKETAPRDAVVFHSSWGDFPLLFCFNTQNRYIAGLGLHYLYLADTEIHDTYVELCEGTHPDPAARIIETFGARYAYTRKHQIDFIASLDRDPAAHRAYEDDYSIVFRLTPKR